MRVLPWIMIMLNDPAGGGAYSLKLYPQTQLTATKGSEWFFARILGTTFSSMIDRFSLSKAKGNGR